MTAARTALVKVVLDAGGFTVMDGVVAVGRVRWAEVRHVAAYKRDLLTTDRICLDVWTVSGAGLTIDEDMAGFNPLVRALPQAVPGLEPDWRAQVVLPPFVENRRTVFRTDSRETSGERAVRGTRGRRKGEVAMGLFGKIFGKGGPATPADGDLWARTHTPEAVNALAALGLLERIYLFPVEYGGAEADFNAVFVPPAAAREKTDVDAEVGQLLEDGKVSSYCAAPQYDDTSLIPTRIVIEASGEEVLRRVIPVARPGV